ncbi:DsbA family protein [Aequoribacter sp.]|uniref:thiol:disulfide interchange protein DsbA/DsbL n=2 Tax=Aequoribacter sp. TaxID=2847771 RepID=UPI003C5A2CED
MKLQKLIGIALASIVLAACASDDTPTAPVAEPSAMQAQSVPTSSEVDTSKAVAAQTETSVEQVAAEIKEEAQEVSQKVESTVQTELEEAKSALATAIAPEAKPKAPVIEDNYKEGEHYELVVPPFRTANPDKIEVREFFWYGCGHCYSFEPLLTAWKKNLANYVDFQPSPAIWNGTMKFHAQVFFAIEALGLGDTMHKAIFQAMHVDRNPLSTEAQVVRFFESQGVSENDFNKAFKSFGVGSQVTKAEAVMRQAAISGTPELVVNGKYRISTRKAGSQANMLKIADALVERERRMRAAN